MLGSNIRKTCCVHSASQPSAAVAFSLSPSAVLLDEIERLRYDVYIEEQAKVYSAALHDERRLPDPLDEGAYHFTLRKRGYLVGYLRAHATLPPSISARLGVKSERPIAYLSRLITRPEVRGSPEGAIRLLRSAYDCMARAGVVASVAHTSSQLVPLWERMGNRCFGKAFSMPGVGLQQPVVMIVGDLKHLHSCRSPLASCFQPDLSPEELEAVKNLFWPGIDGASGG